MKKTSGYYEVIADHNAQAFVVIHRPSNEAIAKYGFSVDPAGERAYDTANELNNGLITSSSLTLGSKVEYVGPRGDVCPNAPKGTGKVIGIQQNGAYVAWDSGIVGLYYIRDLKECKIKAEPGQIWSQVFTDGSSIPYRLNRVNDKWSLTDVSKLGHPAPWREGCDIDSVLVGLTYTCSSIEELYTRPRGPYVAIKSTRGTGTPAWGIWDNAQCKWKLHCATKVTEDQVQKDVDHLNENYTRNNQKWDDNG